MVFAVATFAKRFTTFALKIDGSGVEKKQVQIRKQTSAVLEQSLLNQVFCATGGERCSPILVVGIEFFSLSGHRPVQMVLFQLIGSGNCMGSTPLLGS